MNESHGWEKPSPCFHNMTDWELKMDRLYTYFYLFLLIPGLLLNTIALWVLCRHMSKRSKAVIFMVNLAVADLSHVLSLPLRIYYYFTHTWPFGRSLCLLCFYLKYLNMYASIIFLVCISVQRCVFLLKPFSARQWRRRYDLLISLAVWLLVGFSCSPFILMRSSSSNTTNGYTSHVSPSLSTGPISGAGSPKASKAGCFKDLPIRQLSHSKAVIMMALAELFGFLLPLAAISYCSVRIAQSLSQRQSVEQQTSMPPLSPLASTCTGTASPLACRTGKQPDKQPDGEKHHALQMVLGCSVLFLFCFAPYHLNFLLYMLVSQDIVTHCATRLAVLQFHPVSLCLASLSCCLNPLLYYFLTAEFRSHLKRRSSSFTSALLSSPVTSSSQRPKLLRERLVSMESTSSCRE